MRTIPQYMTLQHSPVIFCSKALLPIDVDIDYRNPDEVLQQECTDRLPATVEQLTSHRQYLLEAAKANIQKALEKQKEQYDRKHANPNAFTIREMVLRKDFIRKRRAEGKMEARYLDPYSDYKVPWKRVLRPTECCRSQR